MKKDKGSIQTILVILSSSLFFIIGAFILILLLVGYYVIYGPCGLSVVSEAQNKLDDYAQKYTDDITLSTGTPKIVVTDLVARMQATRRDLQKIDVPDCLNRSKVFLIGSMEETIDGYILAMTDEEKNKEKIERKFKNGIDYLFLYKNNTEYVESCKPFCY